MLLILALNKAGIYNWNDYLCKVFMWPHLRQPLNQKLYYFTWVEDNQVRFSNIFKLPYK